VWDWAIWAGLCVGTLAAIAALALLAARMRRAWRALKETRQAVVGGLDELAAAGETTAGKVPTAGDTAELQESLGHLRSSLARLAVLRAAIDDAQDTFGRVTAVVPRK
jgi:hypothetical protein